MYRCTCVTAVARRRLQHDTSPARTERAKRKTSGCSTHPKMCAQKDTHPQQLQPPCVDAPHSQAHSSSKHSTQQRHIDCAHSVRTQRAAATCTDNTTEKKKRVERIPHTHAGHIRQHIDARAHTADCTRTQPYCSSMHTRVCTNTCATRAANAVSSRLERHAP